MSKANHSRQPHRAPARHGSIKQGASPSHRKPCASTQELIVRIWDTLDWPKTLQAAFLIAAAGLTAALLLAGLVVAAHMISSQVAAWPVGITVTATVSYSAARGRRR
jgi:hypothetical protein